MCELLRVYFWYKRNVTHSPPNRGGYVSYVAEKKERKKKKEEDDDQKKKMPVRSGVPPDLDLLGSLMSYHSSFPLSSGFGVE